eukprot:TRINITY_DN10485_c0_g1_i1.p1 TRINITY_DN10485_c0_g1~~TRINITY_DN10485_c0_g1_i1.p1  ORF type:complete len:388 (+),score=36.60 TRINITY_DN10485_c0_g1_i1:2-1165(+)
MICRPTRPAAEQNPTANRSDRFHSHDLQMDAIVFRGKDTVACHRVSKPAITGPNQAIVKVQLAGLCGSDLHVYHDREGCHKNVVMGHEFVGLIEQVSPDISHLFTLGQRVACPFTTSCGDCDHCNIGLTCRCPEGALFGYGNDNGVLHGGQAEYVLVPLATGTLVRVPENVSNDAALLAGDILSTAMYCCQNGGLGALAEQSPAASIIVIGCGPVGLLAILYARSLSEDFNIIALDLVEARLQYARNFGATHAVDSSSVDLFKTLIQLAEGRGPPVVLELVGGNKTLRLAYDLVGHGGCISSIGVNNDEDMPFNANDMYNKNLTLKVGRCPARHLMVQAMQLSTTKLRSCTDIITHRLPLADGMEAYRRFANREEGVIKTVFEIDSE